MQQQQKRPLPPTPATSTKYTNVNDAIHSLLSETAYDTLSERERRWYNELSNCHKSLEQKDSTINNLKTIVMEWKKKAVEYDNAYKELKRLSEERERFLIKQHTAEMEALSKAQIDQINSNLEVILQLERENEELRSHCNRNNEPTLLPYQSDSPEKTSELQQQQQQQQQLPTIESKISNTSQLCNEAEDMVSEMEDTLQDLQHSDEYQDEATTTTANIPALVTDSDSSSSSSSEGEEEEEDALTFETQQKPLQPQQLRRAPLPVDTQPKKRSNKNATIPSFLFRHKKFDHSEKMTSQQKKAQSLYDANRTQQRKPLHTSLFVASS
ncbi:hypothetical protein BDF20DRAFT_823526 [Mycotypha africana]|uniref:uncharacterized protein n=1 Tax=Mycotypha africana TaxID=64632 RepID=UPI002301913A|nr:uncharacterized protein BDF20DRAFT_823526 [Mycotypha africana]KAI8973199.1 hypothetical protein BDF20DRAFT_823526 [Mycotypha africana]